MSMAGITKERDSAVGIHHPEGQGGTETGIPPFMLTHDHEAGDFVDIAGASPFEIRASVSAEIGAWRVTVE